MRLLAILLVTAVFCSVITSCHESRIFFVRDAGYHDIRTVAVVAWKDGGFSKCEILSEDEMTEAILITSKGRILRHPTPAQIHRLLDHCTTFSSRKLRSVGDKDVSLVEDGGEYKMITPTFSPLSWAADAWVIFSGTKWCGPGDRAENDDDLGFYQDTDRCCRAHDKCDDLIVSGETKHNLTNKSSFTKLNCNCDDEFHACLNRVNSAASNSVGNAYFNVLKRPCYFYDNPITKKCKKYKTLFKLKCLEYEKSTKAENIWQWREAKMYKKIPISGPFDVTLSF